MLVHLYEGSCFKNRIRFNKQQTFVFILNAFPTSLQQESSESRKSHPRHSRGLGLGSTRHRLFRKHRIGAGGAGPPPPWSQRRAVAAERVCCYSKNYLVFQISSFLIKFIHNNDNFIFVHLKSLVIDSFFKGLTDNVTT